MKKGNQEQWVVVLKTVCQYGAPKNQPYVILEEEPNDCFWVHCRSGRLTVKGNAYPKEIKPQKKQLRM